MYTSNQVILYYTHTRITKKEGTPIYTIVLSNQKGGVSKTTTCHALATGLYDRGGGNVLVVDMDPQCNLSYSCGVSVGSGPALYDVFSGRAAVRDVVVPVRLGLDIVPGGLALSRADAEFIQKGKETMLRDVLAGISGDYDFCVIDTPPTLGLLTTNALAAAQTLVVPLTADLYAIQGLSQLYGLVQSVRAHYNPGLYIAGLLLTKHHLRTIIDRDLKAQIETAAQRIGTRLFKSSIRESVTVREAQLLGKNLFTDYPRAKATQDYSKFVNEFLAVIKEREGKHE